MSPFWTLSPCGLGAVGLVMSAVVLGLLQGHWGAGALGVSDGSL